MSRSSRLGKRGGLVIAVVVVALVGVGALVFWFAPHKLFVDDRAAEATPEGRVLAQGTFRSLEHETKGVAKIVEQADGSRVLRFEDLVTSNGPDLVVMLSDTPATEDGWSAYDDGAHVILEPLKGNLGSQNYALAADVDPKKYRSAVIWCRRFKVAFGSASIE